LNQFAYDPTNPEFLANKAILDAGMLKKMASSIGLFDILLVHPDGRIVYTTNSEHYQKYFLNFLPDPGQKAFKEGKEKIYISDVFLNQREGNKPELLLTAPAFDSKGVFIGVIAFEVDMAPLYRLIQDVTGLGETGETLLGKKIGNQVVYLNPLRHDLGTALKKTVTIGADISRPIQKAAHGRNGPF